MKFKKLLAVMLSLSSIISTLPMTMQTANAAEDEIQVTYGETIIDENFDDGVNNYPAFNVSDSNTRWKSEVKDGRIGYTVDGTKVGEGASLSVFSNGNVASLDPDKTYEFHYTLDTREIDSYVWINPLILRDANEENQTAGFLMQAYNAAKNWEFRQSGFSNNIISGASINSPIEVTVTYKIVDYKDADGKEKGKAKIRMSYTNKSNNPVVIERSSEFFSRKGNAGKAIADRVGVSVVEQDSQVKTQAMGTFYLDNIYVKEVILPEVTFNYNDGETDPTTAVVNLDYNIDENKFPKPADRDTDTDGDIDFKFDGWYTEDGEKFDGKNVSEDTVVTAKWLPQYTVSFESNGGSEVEKINTTTGKIENVPEPDWDMAFVGWFYDNETFERPFDANNITEDVTVYAAWKPGFDITFDVNGGPNPIKKKTVSEKLKTIPEPLWVGYQFDGWFREDGTAFDGYLLPKELREDDIPDEGQYANITVTAEWTKMWKINLNVGEGEDIDLYNGEDINTLYVLGDLTPDKLPTTTKKGGKLIGWFWDSKFQKPFDGKGIAEYMADRDVKETTIYAKYDDVLFYEDFENTDGTAYLKQLSANDWVSYVEEGGVQPDGNNGHYFRVAGESGKRIVISGFDVMEPGLYEVSYKIWLKNKSFYGAVGLPLFKDEAGGLHEWNKPYFYGKEYIINTVTSNPPRLSIYNKTNSTTGPKDFVDFIYRYDTAKKTLSVYANWVDQNGQAQKAGLENRSFSSANTSVDALTLVQIDSNNSGLLDVYIDDICLRKVQQPKITSTTPTADKTDISTMPKVNVTFDRVMDVNTLIPENLYVADKEGNAVPAQVTAETTDGTTVAAISLSEKLDYDTTYNIVAKTAISDGTYFLDKEYAIPFKTEPEKYQAEAFLTTKQGAVITDMSQYKGKSVKLVVNFRNYNGADEEKLFVGVAVVDTETNMQKSYWLIKDVIIEAKDKGTMKNIYTNNWFSIPGDATDKYRVEVFFWDSTDDCDVLLDKIVLPQTNE